MELAGLVASGTSWTSEKWRQEAWQWHANRPAADLYLFSIAGGGARPPSRSGAKASIPSEPRALPAASNKIQVSELHEAAKIELSSLLSNLHLMPDSKYFYVLDRSNNEVLKVDFDSFTVQLKTALPSPAVCFTISPDGSRLFAAGPIDSKWGKLFELGPDLEILSSLRVDYLPVRIVADDNGRVYISCRTDHLMVVDMDIHDTIGRANLDNYSYLQLYPDQTRLYAGDTAVTPGDFDCILLSKDIVQGPQLYFRSYDSRYHGDHPLGDYPLGQDLRISPDGRYLIGSNGPVLKLAAKQDEDLEFFEILPAWSAAAFAPGYSTFFIGEPKGKICAYSQEDFSQPVGVFYIDKHPHEMIFDGKGKRLLVIASPPEGEPSLADLYCYSIDDSGAQLPSPTGTTAEPSEPAKPSKSLNPTTSTAAKPTALPAASREIQVGDEFPSEAKIALDSQLAGLHLAPDGESFYVLDKSRNEVLRVYFDPFTVQQRVTLPDPAVCLTMTPDGSRLFAAAQMGSEWGKLIELNPGLEVVSSFRLDHVPVRIVADDNGRVYVSRDSQWEGLMVVDVNLRDTIGSVYGILGGSYLRLHPDQTRLYTGDFGNDFYCVRATQQRLGAQLFFQEYDSSLYSDYPLGGDFKISPDGRYLIGSRGPVLQLAAEADDDMRYEASIPEWSAAALAPGYSTFFIGQPTGRIYAYSLDDLDPVSVLNIDRYPQEMLFDAKGKRLVVIVSAAEEERLRDRTLPAADLYLYSIPVRITPPWRQWWACCLYVLILGAALFGYLVFRIQASQDRYEP